MNGNYCGLRENLGLENQPYLPSFIKNIRGGQLAKEPYILISSFMLEVALYKKLLKACFGHSCTKYSQNVIL